MPQVAYFVHSFAFMTYLCRDTVSSFKTLLIFKLTENEQKHHKTLERRFLFQ